VKSYIYAASLVILTHRRDQWLAMQASKVCDECQLVHRQRTSDQSYLTVVTLSSFHHLHHVMRRVCRTELPSRRTWSDTAAQTNALVAAHVEKIAKW